MNNNCPFCKSSLNQVPTDLNIAGFNIDIDCSRCGRFTIARDVYEDVPGDRRFQENLESVAKVSHGIRKMQSSNSNPRIDRTIFEALLKRDLPSIREQLNNLILWIGNNTASGKEQQIQYKNEMSITGAKEIEGIKLIIDELKEKKYLKVIEVAGTGNSGRCMAVLTFSGREYFEELKRGEKATRKAFMAMGYKNAITTDFVNDTFRSAVKATGFDLVRLDDYPPGV